jgi:HPr kinase/phosphorylase
MKNFITVDTAVKDLKLDVLNKANLNDEIKIFNSYRANIELLNYIFYEKIDSIIIWSGRESRLLNKFKNVTKIRDGIKNVLKCHPPLIVITEKFEYRKILKNMCEAHKINLCITKHSSSQFISIANEYVFKHIGVFRPVSGTLINIYGVGALIRMKLMNNKSEIILSLLKNGHLYIGDDAIDTSYFGNRVYGKGNDLTKKFLELRGIGVVNVEKMYGIQKVMDMSPIDLVIELSPTYDSKRIVNQSQMTSICNIVMPYYQVSSTTGKDVARLIEACVTDYKLKKISKYNSGDDFTKILQKLIDSNDE